MEECNKIICDVDADLALVIGSAGGVGPLAFALEEALLLAKEAKLRISPGQVVRITIEIVDPQTGG